MATTDATAAAGASPPPAGLCGPVYSSVSVLRAAEIMAFGSVSSGQLARALSCNIRTARRVLDRLVAEGWAQRTGDARPRFSLTFRAAAMGAQALSRSPFAGVAARVVGEVAERAGRPAYVVVPCYEQLLCVASSDRAVVRRGDVVAAAGSPGGLVLLAHRPAWRAALERCDRDGELERVRKLGLARVGGEVALPVPCNGDGVLGALVFAAEPEEVAVVELARVQVSR